MANFKSYAYDKQTGQWVPVGVSDESIPTKLTDLLDDETHRTVTDEQIDSWDSKAAIYRDTTQNWNSQNDLISENGALYVYDDYDTKTVDGKIINIPNIKIGDGKAYVVDLPFINSVGADMLEHMTNSILHVTSKEKEFWNNKVSAFISDKDAEILVLTTS